MSMGMDAVLHLRDGLQVFAFPLFAMIHQRLIKICLLRG